MLSKRRSTEKYVAALRIVKTIQDSQERRFSGAVGAEQRAALAATDTQAQTVQRGHSGIAVSDIADVKNGILRQFGVGRWRTHRPNQTAAAVTASAADSMN